MRSFYSYIYPATLLHFALVLAYDLIWLAGFAGPIDSWWTSQGDRRPVIYLLTYIGFVGLIATLGVAQRWSDSLRWVLETGARRGLRLGGVPVLDLGLLTLLAVLALFVANVAPEAASLGFYLMGPLAFATLLNLLFALPPELHVIADRAQPLADLAHAEGCDPVATARANGLGPQAIAATVAFAKEIRLPLDGRRATNPAPTSTPPPSIPAKPGTSS